MDWKIVGSHINNSNKTAIAINDLERLGCDGKGVFCNTRDIKCLNAQVYDCKWTKQNTCMNIRWLIFNYMKSSLVFISTLNLLTTGLRDNHKWMFYFKWEGRQSWLLPKASSHSYKGGKWIQESSWHLQMETSTK